MVMECLDDLSPTYYNFFNNTNLLITYISHPPNQLIGKGFDAVPRALRRGRGRGHHNEPSFALGLDLSAIF